MRTFTRAELARFDGASRRAYVAVKGWVYDVTGSGEWPAGFHRELHWAGQDLTAYLPEAPHGIETLERFPIVGALDDVGPVALSAPAPEPGDEE